MVPEEVKVRGRAGLRQGGGGWPGDTEMAEAMGTDPMSRISCLSKVCPVKYVLS